MTGSAAAAPSRFASALLTLPELFPARIAGPSWGSHRIVLELPGGPYELEGLNEAQRRGLERYFADFLAVAADAPISVRVMHADAAEFQPPPPEWHEYRLELDYPGTAVRVAGHDFFGRLEWGSRGASAGFWTCAAEPDAFAPACENFLRVLLAFRQLDRGSLLIHSAVICRDGNAVMAVGPSGAGKTTLCEHAVRAGWEVVSDELNLVEVGVGGVRTLQMPFAGDFGRATRVNGSLPLRAICRLGKASADSLRPISKAESSATLLAAAPFVNLDLRRSSRLLEVVEGIVERVPTYRFDFALGTRLEVLAEQLTATSPADVPA